MAKQSDIDIARVHDEAFDTDRSWLRVDLIWPRDISKEDLGHDDWIKDIAPTTELRKWFDHDAGTGHAGCHSRQAAEVDATGQGAAMSTRQGEPAVSGAGPKCALGQRLDFTYVSTWQGFVYVAFVIDTFANRIFACLLPSQPPSKGCCDDQLRPPSMCRSAISSVWLKPGSNPRWAV